MKRILAVLLPALFLFVPSEVYSQKEDYIWAFGDNGGLNFHTDPPTPFITNMHSLEGVASVCDAAGNLLFYTNGATVWSRNNAQMPNGHGLLGNTVTSASEGVVIVQDVAAPGKYYIFVSSESEEFPTRYLRYNIVDMSLNGSYGDVVTKNVIIDSGVSEMVTVAGNGTCERWVIDHHRENTIFHAFHLTAGGLDIQPVVSNTGLNAEYAIGMIKANANSDKIAVLTSNGDPQKPGSNAVQLFDFDINTGYLSYDQLAIRGQYSDSVSDQFWSMAFSPSGNKLYTYSMPSSGSVRIYQTDLTQVLPVSKVLRTGISGLSDIKAGPDKKLYFRSSEHKFGIIQYPDLDAPACGLTVDALDAYPSAINNGLPNDVIRTNIPYTHMVVSCGDKDTLDALITGLSYLWNTGATTPLIICDTAGTYWLQTTTACGVRTDTFILSFRGINFHLPDTVSCNNTPVILAPALNGNYTYRWQDGSNNPTYTATVSGTYYLTVNDDKCSAADTAYVTIYPPLNASLLPGDTILCEQDFPFTITASPLFPTYDWSDSNATGRVLIVDSPGIYWLSKQTVCGLYTDTMRITGCLPGFTHISVNTDTICENRCIRFIADSFSNITAFEWSFPGGTPDTFYGPYPPDICYFKAGTYPVHLHASNTFGNVYRDTVLYVLPAPAPRFTDTMITAKYQGSLGLPACSDAQRIEWYKDDSLVCIGCNPLIVTAIDWKQRYTCVVYNATCRDECKYEITTTGIPADAWLPSAFSPNNDGRNDRFRLITDNPNITLVELSVYDRWGERLYHAQQNGEGWDGTYNHHPSESGTYFWYLRYKVLGQDDIYTRKGELSLIR